MTDLPTRTLGRTGATVTTLGYGAMELRGAPRGREIPAEQAERVLNAVLDGGITLIDTSPDYGQSEELIGRFISHRRDEYFLATSAAASSPSSRPRMGRATSTRPRTSARRSIRACAA